MIALMGPHNSEVPAYGYGKSKIIVLLRITGGQLGQFAPIRAITLEDIGRTRGTAFVVITISPHNGIVTTDGYGSSELVVRGCLTGGQLGQLDPIRAVTFEDIGRTRGTATVVITRSPHNGIVTADGYGNSKIVI